MSISSSIQAADKKGKSRYSCYTNMTEEADIFIFLSFKRI